MQKNFTFCTDKFLALTFMTISIVLLILIIFMIKENRIKPDLDCADFKSQPDAQKEFNSQKFDIYGLDNNKNGVACELLK